MVGDQKTPAHRYTVGALSFQAVVLLGFAALVYFGSLSTTAPFAFTITRAYVVFFGVLGAIAVWLTGKHYTNHVRSSRLKLWATICIVVSYNPVALFTVMLFSQLSTISLVRLIQSLLFLIPSILVYIFSRKEIPSN